MTTEGIVLLDLVLLLGLSWVLELVRRGRLWVGYGVIFVVSLLGLVLLISLPGLLAVARSSLERLYPSASLTTVGLGGVGFLLIYVLSQLTILSNRLSRVVQELAIREGGQPTSPPREVSRGR